MRLCLICAERFSDGWTCPRCAFAPEQRSDGVLVFERCESDGFEARYFDELAEVESTNFWFRSRNTLISWALRRYAPTARRFLEVGCGNGFVLRGLQNERPELDLEGGELFDEGLVVARRRLPEIPLYRLDARQLPFDSEFDAIGAFDVLEHIEEDETALREMHRSVMPGGTLLLTVPQHRWLWSAADDYARHQRRYSRAELLAKVEAAGFEAVHTTSFVVLLLPMLLLSRLLRRSEGDGYDALRELALPAPVNRALELVTSLELALTKRGARWPAGGSLVVVGRRPEASA